MPEIIHEETRAGGRYVSIVEGVEAELTYSRMESSGNIIADHTGVPTAIGGRGVGKALVTFMIPDASAREFKIMPLCPFVRPVYIHPPERPEVRP